MWLTMSLCSFHSGIFLFFSFLPRVRAVARVEDGWKEEWDPHDVKTTKNLEKVKFGKKKKRNTL